MGEPVGSAFVELRLDSGAQLQADVHAAVEGMRKQLAGIDEIWAGIRADAEKTGESIQGSMIEAARQSDDSLDKIGGADVFGDVKRQAEGTGESVQGSFQEAARQSDVALDKIGGADVFGDVKREAASAGESVERSFREAAVASDRHMGAIGGGATRMFGVVSTAVAAFGGAALFKGAIDQASDLNESLNAVNVSFGDNAAGVTQLGEAANTALGLTQGEFNGLAVQFGSFSKTIAGPGGDVVGTLDSITKRASDFASVMNVDVADAAQLFQSGLAGETEPLRKYGIDLSAANVEQFALANGIIKTGDTMTEAQKVQARYGSLMAQTNQVQGDFSNTSGELANGLRILRATALETGASFGTAFLPALKGVVGGLNDTVAGLAGPISALGTAMGTALQPLMDALGPTLGVTIGVLSDVFRDLGSVIGSLAPLLSPVVQVAGVLATFLSGTLAVAFKALEPAIAAVASFLDKFAEALGQTLFDALDALTPVLTMVGKLFGDVLADVLPIVLDLFKDLGPPLIRIITALAGPLLEALPGIAKAFLAVVHAVEPLLKTGLLTFLDAIATALEILAPILPIIIDAWFALQGALLAVEIAQAALNIVMEANPIGLIIVAILALIGGVKLAYDHFQGFHDAVDAAWQIMQNVWDFITNVFVVGWHGLIDAIHATLDWFAKIPGALSDAFGSVVSFITDLPGEVAGFIVDLIEKFVMLHVQVMEAVAGLVLEALTALGKLALDALKAIGDMVTGIVDFFLKLPGQALSALGSLGSMILQAISPAAGMATSAAGTLVHDVLQYFIDLPGNVWGGLQVLGGKLKDAIGGAATDAKNAAIGLVKDVVDEVGKLPGQAIHALGDIGSTIFDTIKDAFKGVWNRIVDTLPEFSADPLGRFGPSIHFGFDFLKLAAGAILNNPTRLFPGVLAGEAGSEAVIPMTRPGRAMELMQASGLGAMWDRMSRAGQPLTPVQFGDVFVQQPTDADLIAQRTYAAWQTRMIAA